MSGILIVEDEVVLARSIVSFLERRGFSASYAVDAASGRAMIERDAPRLVILDYKLNEDDGLDVLEWIRSTESQTNVVMMTGHGDIDIAVRAMKAGARDFLVKPTPLSSIAAIASELMLDEMQGGLDRTGADRIIGRSSAANALRATIRKLGKSADPRPGVLIIGPEGTGKSLAALALHETAAPDRPLETLDCALSDEAELDTLFDRAAGGSLLLRHVSGLSAAGQARLLHLLTQSQTPPALIATSERHLTPGQDILPELLYALQVGWIDMPPLSERAADVLPIADLFARRIARERGEARPRFTSAARAKLLEHDWPGNVSELENCIERAMLLQTDGQIDTPHIRAIGEGQTGDIPTLRDVELGAINKALTRTGGNVSRAAELLGISRDTLRYRMEKFELPRR
ncbi:sigma-54-dependent transcriptional regulator [Ovoidimarina sediminis]|uniref:sigma-54-dependent transcriptional regulator n=1 Tax=Ovoidimarina sediminis TaxID=3079856 RepID=UPI0029081FA2|nr:response regulator [Rhodophyticola sp. MJ-SS7]MDU8943175.1 response regulator [Rhodophyticola sp. MJ-SS7]